MKRALALAVAGSLLASCVTNSYRISHAELHRLATTDPTVRGQQVQVTQQRVGGTSPPAAQPVYSDTQVVVGVGFDVRTHGRVPERGHGPGPSHGGRSSSSSGRSSSSSADDAKGAAVALVVLAVAGGVILAVTEGMRYAGTVELHPMHPVHLYGNDGNYAVVPLAHLDYNAVMWSRAAYVRDNEGPWRVRQRAPLRRQGWTYAVLLGSGTSVSADGSKGAGFASHIQAGLFPTSTFGLVLDFGFSWRDNVLGATLYDTRTSLEAQFLPLAAGKFHAGVFGAIGLAQRLEDGFPGADSSSLHATAGPLLQLELTTYLALTARLAIERDHGERTSNATVGISVY